MQNSLERDLDFNLDNFNKKFDETVDSEDYKSLFPSYFFDSNMSPNNTFENIKDDIKQKSVFRIEFR